MSRRDFTRPVGASPPPPPGPPSERREGREVEAFAAGQLSGYEDAVDDFIDAFDAEAKEEGIPWVRADRMGRAIRERLSHTAARLSRSD